MNPTAKETTSKPADEEGFAVGESINRKYVLEKTLGKGGMGLTYLASDADNINRKVVIKTILKELSTPAGKTAFLKEGEALGRINHDGVVRLFDKGEDEETGLPFLVMEYVKGKPLNEIIRREQMDVEKAVEIAEKIAFALNAVHQQGIFHRDLKPANIMIIESDNEDEKVKLIDFGVAKIANSIVGGETTQFGSFKGTFMYASPEQFSGFQTVAGETFNLAAIAYEMLTQVRAFQLKVRPETDEGIVAFQGRCYVQIKNLHKAGAKNPQEINPKIPNATAQAILKGLEYDADNRYQTPVEFAQSLKQSLVEKQVEILTLPIMPSAPKKFLWKKVFLAAVFVLAVSLFGLAYRTFLYQPVSSNSNVKSASANTSPMVETLFNYSLEVQKLKDNLIVGKPFATVDKLQIVFGDKFNLKIERQKGGRFYLIEQNDDVLNLIFPDGNPDAKSISTWRVSKPNQTFWLIWSNAKIDLLETTPLNQAEVNQFLQKNKNSSDAEENQDNMEVKSDAELVIYKLPM